MLNYSHTVNPKAGLLITLLKSVATGIPHAEIAGAMTIPVAIMAMKSGQALTSQTKNTNPIVAGHNNRIYPSKILI